MTETLAETVTRIDRSFKNAKWVTCPICEEEWSKLHPCRYYGNNGDTVTNVCVQCGETLRSFWLISQQNPAQKKFDNWPDGWVTVHQTEPVVYKDMPLPRTIVASVKVYPGDTLNSKIIFDWHLYVDNVKIVLFDRNENIKIGEYENVYQAWFACKKKIENWTKTFFCKQTMLD